MLDVGCLTRGRNGVSHLFNGKRKKGSERKKGSGPFFKTKSRIPQWAQGETLPSRKAAEGQEN